MPKTFYKQPAEVLDFDFNWDTWMPAGDSLPASIATSVVTAESGITLVTNGKTHPGSNVVKQFISGGVSGFDYKVTCRITTTQSRVKEADITIRVRDS